jgi:phosphoadenosine phosphosulfate reductase
VTALSAHPLPPPAAAPLSFLHHDASVLQDLYDASDGLPHLAAHAGAALENANPQEILRWADERFGQRLAVATSMSDGVLAHMAAGVRPGIRVLFLDTGYHFAETIGTADAVGDTLPIELLRVRPHLSVAEQDAAFGTDLFARDPDLCCAMRKVAPLAKALAPYVAWVSGIRRDEATTRSDVGVVEWDERHQKVKINPLATWTQQDVERYVADNDILVNPLLSEGYGSIGCAPCTHRGEGRTGRWLGQSKVECGLHS